MLPNWIHEPSMTVGVLVGGFAVLAGLLIGRAILAALKTFLGRVENARAVGKVVR